VERAEARDACAVSRRPVRRSVEPLHRTTGGLMSTRLHGWHRLPLLVAVAAVMWRLRAFLPPHTLPARGDPGLPFAGSDLTPQWVPWLRVSIDALWHNGSLAFWNPLTHAGAPTVEAAVAGWLT